MHVTAIVPPTTIAVFAALLKRSAALGYATASGFWLLLPLRPALGPVLSPPLESVDAGDGPPQIPVGISRRSGGRSRAIIAIGPMIASRCWRLGRGEFLVHGVIFFFLCSRRDLRCSAWPPARRLPAEPPPRFSFLSRVAPASAAAEQPRCLVLPGRAFSLDGLFIIGLS